MQAWAQRLAAFGKVVAFDYPYMKAGRKTPDKQPALIAAHRQALDEARAADGGKYATAPVIFAGKSMGSRIGCHLAVELAEAGAGPAGLICFGYPLRAMGSGALRDEVLRALRTPILFLAGSRDPLCPLADLATARAAMTAPNELFVVDGGDHSLEVRKRASAAAGKSQADWDGELVGAIAAFLTARGLSSRA
jgi:predicted alpha/beta-hydrolase family hydrolase